MCKCGLLTSLLDPANGIGLKIWQCYDNLRAQQWNYERYSDRIRLDAQVNGNGNEPHPEAFGILISFAVYY